MNVLAVPTDAEVEQLANGHDRSDLLGKDLDTLYAEARYHREQAEVHQRQAVFHWMQCGMRLQEIKARTQHGDWLATVRDEIGVPERTAQVMMHLAKNTQRVALLLEAQPDIAINATVQALNEAKREDRHAEGPRPNPYRTAMLPETCDIEVADAAALPLPEDLVDLIVTSPPYGLGIEYADTDDAEGYLTYLEHANAWSDELFRVAAPQGRLCLNVPLDVSRGGQQAMYADWLYCLKAAGWTYQSTIIWNEDNVSKSTARGTVDSPAAPHVMARAETIIVMRKGEWNLHRVAPHDLEHDEWLAWTNGTWTFPGAAPLSPDHCPKPFPEELPRRCITLFSYRGDVIMDPFLGSGTTGVVAATMGRRFYGFDHSPKYVEQARDRVREAVQRMAAA